MRPLLMLSSLLAWFSSSTSGGPLPEPADCPVQAEFPDPLLMRDGTRITTKEEWMTKRRPELKELFQHYMYGTIPPAPAKVSAKLLYKNEKAFDGKATLRELALTIGPPEAPPIYLLLVTPNASKGAVPCFVGLNFSGNHALVDDKEIHLPTVWMYPDAATVKDNQATEAGRGKAKQVWNLEQSIDRGYAVATFYNGDVDPDRADVRGGIRPFLTKKDAKPDPAGIGSIAAWAWGVMRAVDYLCTDPAIDSAKIIVVGHSRLGKAAIVAAAFDDRIALAIPHQAGCGGTAPDRSKNTKSESIKQINDRFPHWLNENFKHFGDNPAKLPFDQHCLVALIAPRPVLFSNAAGDQWSNPDGQFEVLKGADPVYRLLGAGGLEAKTRPVPGILSAGTLGYFYREGKHSMSTEDWKAFLDYADKKLKR